MGIASLVVFSMGQQIAFGQTIQIVEGLSFSTGEVAFIIGIGVVAGIIRAWQGYDKSPNDFDLLYFVASIRDAALIAIPVAFTAAMGFAEINALAYVLIFFSVWGATGAVNTARKQSIPSNASPDEIENILSGRN